MTKGSGERAAEETGHSTTTTRSLDLSETSLRFDLSGLSGGVTSVTLELQRYQSLAATYSLFDVSTDPVTLNNNTGTSATIFEDLGTGTSYGSFVVAGAGLPTDVLSFALNAAALADIAGAAGGFFSIGGMRGTWKQCFVWCQLRPWHSKARIDGRAESFARAEHARNSCGAPRRAQGDSPETLEQPTVWLISSGAPIPWTRCLPIRACCRVEFLRRCFPFVLEYEPQAEHGSLNYMLGTCRTRV